jgi:hypothetical protein
MNAITYYRVLFPIFSKENNMRSQKKSLPPFNNSIFSALCVSFLNLPIQNNTVPWTNGVGSRAMSFAGNYVSESNDFSGLFWNPAGLSLKRSNSLTVSGDWLMLKAHTSLFSDNNIHSTIESISLNSIGLIGVSEEYPGLSTGIGFQNPYSFNDINNLQTTFLQNGDSIEINERFVSHGGLNFWSVGSGFPISENFSLGATFSLVRGTQKVLTQTNQHTKSQSSHVAIDNFTSQIERIYKGYDLRFGFLFQSQSWLRTGGRLVVPTSIDFVENSVQKFIDNDSSIMLNRKGRLCTPFSGALGVSIICADAVISGEFRFRAPYDYFEVVKSSPESDASMWKRGAGAGIEVNLRPLPLSIRTGYSLDQIDPCAFLVRYHDSTTVYPSNSSGLQKTISAGIGFNLSENAYVNCTYLCYIQNLKYRNGLSENNYLQRVLLDLIISY